MPTTFAPGSACLYATNSQRPAIALNSGNQFVEIHQDTNQNLYYSLGNIVFPTFQLNRTEENMNQKGHNAGVALKDKSQANFVLFVWVDNNSLWAFPGEVDFINNVINFNNYNKGVAQIVKSDVAAVSVAINSDGAIVLFIQDTSNNLRYKTGYVDEQKHTITWSNSQQYADSQSGIHPRIAMNTAGNFVMVHQSEDFDSLYYNLGVVKISNNIVTLDFMLESDTEYLGLTDDSESTTPAVAMNGSGSSGMIFEAHEASGGYDLYFQNGTMYSGNRTIENFTSDTSKRYFDSYSKDDNMKAQHPAVALNNEGWAIHAYETYGNELFMAVAVVDDRTCWMKEYQDRTLGTMVIPGSHDAGMSEINNSTSATTDNAGTQIQGIGDQLNAGIRYFDIRPIFDNDTAGNTKDIWTGHYAPPGSTEIVGAEGQQMNEVFSQINAFITQASAQTEVVVVKFSHYLNTVGDNRYFSDPGISTTTKQQLIDNLLILISTEIQDSNHLYVHNPSGNRITEKKLSDITNGKGKVIILFDIRDLSGVAFNKDYACTYMDLINPATGTIDRNVSKSSADWVMYDNYSDSDDVSVMASATAWNGQIYRMKQIENHTGDMYLCSWTLTLTGFQPENPVAISILENAQKANGVLARDMVNTFADRSMTADMMPNILYVDAADCFVTDVAKSLNSTANAFLKSLTVSTGSISPVFAPATGFYTLETNAATIEITATASDTEAKIKVNGANTDSGNPVSVYLKAGNNTISVIVTARNGTTAKTYTIHVINNQ